MVSDKDLPSMAELLSFSGTTPPGVASFTLTDTPEEGTELLAVAKQGGNKFLLQNIAANPKDNTIRGLVIESDDIPLSIDIKSDSGAVVKDLSASLGDEGDILQILGRTRTSSISTGGGGDTFSSKATFNRSSLDTGDGNDTAEFLSGDGRFAAKNSSVQMGEGDDFAIFKGITSNVSVDMGSGTDRLKFEGNARSIDANLGDGEDTLIFGGNINQARVELGSDGQLDTIKIAEGAKIRGLQILGADENDILLIGTAQYSYEGGTKWVNVEDPSDVRNF